MSSTEVELTMNDLSTTRLIALFSLFALTLLAGLGPVILFRIWNRRKQATILDVSGSHSKKPSGSTSSAVTLQIFMFFGGGVLLATCFVHLIPEVRENFDIYYHSQESSPNGSNMPQHFHSPRHSHDHHGHDHSGEHDHASKHESDPDHHHHDHSVDSTTEIIEVESDNNSTEVLAESEILSSNRTMTDGEDAEPSAPYQMGHTHPHKHSHKHKVPYVELAICGGFFLIYFLEELIHLLIGHDHHDVDEKSAPINRMGDCDSIHTVQTSTNARYDTNSQKGGNDASSPQSPARLIACTRTNGSFGYDNPAIDLCNDLYPSKFLSQPIDGLSNGSNISPTNSFDMLKVPYPVPMSVRFLRGLVTIVAFSAHSVFDGVAIGLQKTSSQLWTIFFAIFMHKLVVAFAIGLELFEQSKSLLLTCIHMILFSLMSPIGILLVIITESEFSERESPVMILLSAVATGTILYIVFFEVLQRERASRLPGLLQFMFLVLGFTCMSCLTLFVDH